MQLSVSIQTVHRLAAEGELETMEGSGSRLLVTSASLRRSMQHTKNAGRPYSPQLALGMLHMLSGEETPWMNHRQRCRIEAFLSSATAEEIAWATRKRARTERLWVVEVALERIASHLILGAATGPSLSRTFGLADGKQVEGYVSAAGWERIEREFHPQQADGDDNLVVHVVDDEVAQAAQREDRRVMPLAVCAIDLMDSLNPRERGAGLRTVEQLLRKWRGSHESDIAGAER